MVCYDRAMETFDNGNIITWAVDLEEGALQQARNAAELSFVHSPVAVMADGHQGYGVPVGAVIATEGAISPYMVGVDIGCGMIARRLNLTSADLPDNLDELHNLIRAAIPAGMGQGHLTPTNHATMPEHSHYDLSLELEKTARTQLGSLGGGNHFVEVCLDEFDRVWLVLHSGSRGIGNKLATQHINAAKGIMAEIGMELPDKDLAYLTEGSAEFDAYIKDLLWCQSWALVNREAMMIAAHAAVEKFLGRWVGNQDQVNCHHNFTAQEEHNGKKLWITRKGAIKASVGVRGVIPGSMGAASFITSGLGNPSSYESSSHGAGRRLGRKAAERVLTVESLREAMAGKSWDESKAEQLLDESPLAYKNIFEVMEAQKDLTRIEHQLHQILNYKGTK
jgi:tRNA-splicing ligase RtcB